jgi:ribosome-associated translation inhibitor RaiA
VIIPLQIEFQNTQPIEPVEFRIRRELAKLEKFYNRLVSCRVEVELPKHERRGSVSKVRIDFGFPAEDAATPPEVRGVAVKQDTEHLQVNAQHKDPVMAVHAAFNTARRRLEDFAR